MTQIEPAKRPSVVELEPLILGDNVSFEADSWGNRQLELPNFDLSPNDYLGFAEAEPSNTSPANLINCVSHLKRALDYQMDTFFWTYGLYKIFSDRNLKRNSNSLKKLAFSTLDPWLD